MFGFKDTIVPLGAQIVTLLETSLGILFVDKSTNFRVDILARWLV